MAPPWRHVWAVNDVSSAQWLNPLPQIFNTSTAMAGTAPDATTTPFVMQGGTGSFTTDGSGNGNIVFPSAMPNGLLLLLCHPWFNGGVKKWLLELANNPSATGCGASLVDSSTGSGVTSQLVTYIYLAIGW